MFFLSFFFFFLFFLEKYWRGTKLRHWGETRADHSHKHTTAASSQRGENIAGPVIIFKIKRFQNKTANPEDTNAASPREYGDICVAFHTSLLLLARKQSQCYWSAISSRLKSSSASRSTEMCQCVMGVTSRWLILSKHHRLHPPAVFRTSLLLSAYV